ncbi:hypothetical protein BH24ACT5_BH24ACT5_14800 [soil metagenome]
MIIVAGRLILDPHKRQPYLDESVAVMTAARRANGCLDFAITADPLEPNRINVFERWDSVDAVNAFRGDGPSDDQMDSIEHADVSQYEIASWTSLT